MSNALVNYSIAINADTTKFIRGMGLARDEAAKVARTLRDSEPAAQKLSREIALLDKAFGDNAGKSKQYSDALNFLKTKYGEVSQAVNSYSAFVTRSAEATSKAKSRIDAFAAQLHKTAAAQKELASQYWAAGMQRMQLDKQWKVASSAIGATEMTKQVQSLEAAWAKANSVVGQYTARTREAFEGTRKVSAATMAAINRRGVGSDFMTAMGMSTGQVGNFAMMGRAGAFGAGFMAIKEGVMAQANAERAQATFSVLLGDLEKANTLIAQMRETSKTSRIRLDDLQKSAQTMLAFGVSAESLIPTLKQIGDITGGDSLRFQMLSLAFSQSAAAGRLMGQDLLQMINAGFNPLQVISQQTGKSLMDLRKEMENGLITFDMVAGAFRSATSEGGKFNGMLQSQANTISGQWRGFMGQVDTLLLKVGQTTGPLATTALKSMQGVLIGTNWALEKFGNAARFAYSGVSDLVQLDFGFTNTNEFLDSLQTAGSVQEKMADNANRQESSVAAIAGYYKQISGIENELAILLDKRASQDQERSKTYEETFIKLQKLRMGEEAFIDMKRKNLGWTDDEINGIRRMENEIKRIEQEAETRKQAKQQADREAEKLLKEQEDIADRLDKKAMEAEKIGSTDAMNPSAMRAGSVEAYKFSLQKQNDQVKRMEQQKKIAEAQLAVQRKTLAAVERMKPMVVVN